MSQVKSKKRISDHGEVYTSDREVNAMLNLVKEESERIESRFLEPACGNGNFLAEILRRKLKVVHLKYKSNQEEYERNLIIAVSNIYGLDILEDNVTECRERLFSIFNEEYTSLYEGQSKEDCRNAVKYLLQKNILLGDALDSTNPITKEPIVFAEWIVDNEGLVKQKDYKFQLLVEQEYEPLRDYPLIHFLNLGNNEV